MSAISNIYKMFNIARMNDAGSAIMGANNSEMGAVKSGGTPGLKNGSAWDIVRLNESLNYEVAKKQVDDK